MNKNLEYRLSLVNEIYKLCMRINVETDLDLMFVKTKNSVSVLIDDKGKTLLHETSVYFKVDFNSHDQMKNQLSELIIKLKSYLGEIDG